MSDGIIIEVIIGIGEAQGTNDTILRLTSDGIAVFFTNRERSATFGVTANFKIHRQSVQSKTSTGILYHKRPQKTTQKKMTKGDKKICLNKADSELYVICDVQNSGKGYE